jgi:hypothetical protein
LIKIESKNNQKNKPQQNAQLKCYHKKSPYIAVKAFGFLLPLLTEATTLK